MGLFLNPSRRGLLGSLAGIPFIKDPTLIAPAPVFDLHTYMMWLNREAEQALVEMGRIREARWECGDPRIELAVIARPPSERMNLMLGAAFHG